MSVMTYQDTAQAKRDNQALVCEVRRAAAMVRLALQGDEPVEAEDKDRLAELEQTLRGDTQ